MKNAPTSPPINPRMAAPIILSKVGAFYVTPNLMISLLDTTIGKLPS